MPVFVMRDTTERPKDVEADILKLVGTYEESIDRTIKPLLKRKEVYDEMSQVNNPYDDGYASKRIADILEYY